MVKTQRKRHSPLSTHLFRSAAWRALICVMACIMGILRPTVSSRSSSCKSCCDAISSPLWLGRGCVGKLQNNLNRMRCKSNLEGVSGLEMGPAAWNQVQVSESFGLRNSAIEKPDWPKSRGKLQKLKKVPNWELTKTTHTTTQPHHRKGVSDSTVPATAIRHEEVTFTHNGLSLSDASPGAAAPCSGPRPPSPSPSPSASPGRIMLPEPYSLRQPPSKTDIPPRSPQTATATATTPTNPSTVLLLPQLHQTRTPHLPLPNPPLAPRRRRRRRPHNGPLHLPHPLLRPPRRRRTLLHPPQPPQPLPQPPNPNGPPLKS